MPKNLSCAVHCGRGILLILNVIFIIVGLLLIGFGVYVKINNNFSSILDQFTDEKGFEAQSLGFLAFAMIGGGVFTLLIALFGCMGTLWNKRCLLYMYAVILLILMIIELIGFIMAFAYKGKVTEVYQTALYEVFERGLKDNNPKIVNAFRELEKALKCCGVYNKTDYEPFNVTQFSEGCTKYPDDGCSKKMIDLLNTNLPIIGYSLLVVFLLELFGLITAIALAVALRHAPDGEEYSSSPGEVIRYVVPNRRRNY